MSDKAIITCALTGVLTNPKQHPVPVTVEEMANAARQAYDAGAAIMHVHFRDQRPGMGNLPSFDPAVATAICDAIRAKCPGVIINMTTGVPMRDQSGPIACLRAVKPEMAACNAGSLNYLKTKSDGSWAWPPMLFSNPVDKVDEIVHVMKETGTLPELECFDVGIVRSIGMFIDVGMVKNPEYNFVMGVASGMPADPDLLPFLLKYMRPGYSWQVTAIGREEVWPLHQKTADLGGHLRTGLEDTFYLPDGRKAEHNGQLVEALAQCAERAGRKVATPAEARALLHLKAA